MNQHQQIIAEMDRQYEAIRDAVFVGPGSLALGVYNTFASGEETPNIQYASIEHIKTMARKFLAKRNDADGEENPAHMAQGELPGIQFSGQLQDRYPLPRIAGEEPVYKLRIHLSPEERAYNVSQLRKSADARNEHADALEAEGQMAA